jgi:3-hydroxybutyryl-CoA dehydrogenase
MAIQTIGVVGSGTMGAGIAQVSAKAGLNVVVARITPGSGDEVKKRVEKGFLRDVEKGKMTEEQKNEIMARVKGTADLDDLKDCDLIVECIVEDTKKKQELFQKLDSICKPETILASNTSTLCSAELRAGVKRTDRFAGVHFFNPVPAMKLVELILPVGAAPDLGATLAEYAVKVGKTPVMVKDMPGYIVNRLLVPQLVEAIRTFEQGVASMADIDTAIQLGLGHPMGPLALSDLIGLDVVMAMAETLYGEFKDTRFAAPPMLKRMLLSGYLGKKSGMGFYDYSQKPPKPNEWLARGESAKVPEKV